MKSLETNSVRMVNFAPESVWPASGNGDGRAEKPRCDVPQGIDVKNWYEAELTNQHRGSGSKARVYSAVPHGGAKWWRYTAFCHLSSSNIRLYMFTQDNVLTSTRMHLGRLGPTTLALVGTVFTYY